MRYTIPQIYFDRVLYMFQAHVLSIIRSLNTVYTEIGICHASCVDCLHLHTSTTGHIFRFSLCYHFQLYIHKKSSQLCPIYFISFPLNSVQRNFTYTFQSKYVGRTIYEWNWELIVHNQGLVSAVFKSRQRKHVFLICERPRPVMGPTVFYWIGIIDISQPGVTLTTHIHIFLPSLGTLVTNDYKI